MKLKYCFLIILLWASKSYAQKSIDVNATIEKLTLEEKEKLVVGSEMEKAYSEGGATGVGETEDKVPGAAGTSLPVDRLGIKKVVFADGPAGVRINPHRTSTPDKTYFATAFPVATMLASTFNLELMQQVGEAFGEEAKEYGVDILLAPALNIHRNPLGGRNFEYYSEDPYLSGKMAAAFTNGVQSKGIGVSIKHFAVNNQETNRSRVNAILSERALREIYLRGFEIAVKESQPWTVMSAYNKVNGVYASESKDLLTTILREEWEFKGFVLTDWFAGEHVSEQLKAGNDLLMPGTPSHKGFIVNAVKEGKLSETELNKNVASILNIYKKTPTFLGYQPSGSPDLETSKTLAKKAATEGIILLKNEQATLPLKNSKGEIALFGIGSYETIAVGTGSGNVNKAYSISILDGLKHQNFSFSESLQETYTKFIEDEKAKRPPKAWSFGPDEILPEKTFTEDTLNEIAKQTQIGIFTLNRTSGEFYDRKQGYDFYLSEEEKKLIQHISKAYHQQNKKFVVILNVGGVVETASWKQFADAILLVWQPGQEGGNAIADIISGKMNPSGKLPMTFPVYYKDAYSSKNFPGVELVDNPYPNPFTGVESEVVYEEDIFVGYRYFESFDVPVSFPFGYGLSYTQFEFSDLEAKMGNDGSISITCKIENTGKVAGKEVVQVYIASPQTNLTKPDKELRAFKKTNTIQSGKSETIKFELSPKDYASFDPDKSAWVTEQGTYEIFVGNSVQSLPLSTKLNLSDTKLVMKTTKSLAPNREIKLLTK
ncbi:MAG: glycosyl hydrolase [Thalassobius sp.]|nr:glycosyl hydrolase [Thalassovita sp.]